MTASRIDMMRIRGSWLVALLGVGGLLGGCSSTAGKTGALSGAGASETPRAAVGALDQLLDEHWRKAAVIPAPAVGDGEFLRRVSLDLIGRVPTLAETRAFLADRGPDKRGRLVDRLLSSP